MNNKRRNFRTRQHKNGFRRRNISIGTNGSNNFNSNGNINFNRNGSINNIHNVEKTMQKFQQLAKDAQSYLQHADHYLRRFNELNDKKENFSNKNNDSEKIDVETDISEKKFTQTN